LLKGTDMETPRRRAIVDGLHVKFESRDPKLISVRWHPRFKMRYRTKGDALMAKAAWEERGKILWPADIRPEKKPAKASVRMRHRAADVQELRL
jgi:hypothetical protein